jgi:pantoate kinase
MVGLQKQYGIIDKAQEKMMEEIKKNPELQKQMEEARDAMMRIEQKTDVNVGVE